MNIGLRIKERRKELKMSADDLAKRLGKDRSTIYRYEKGDIENLPLDILEPIANVLETTPAYLMGWETTPQKNNIDVNTENEEYPESTFNLALEETMMLEYLSCLTQENKDKLMNYAHELLEEQNQKMIQTLARMNRLKTESDE